MTVKTWSPIIAKIGITDYAINGGTAIIQFKKGTEQLGFDYSLTISTKPTVGIIQFILPTASEITLPNFNLPNFRNGQPRAPFKVDTDLTNFLKNTDAPIVKINSIVNLINQGSLEVEIIEENTKSVDNLATGDNVKIIISIGTIYFTTEYSLTVPR